jgi:hypothetical protein
VQPNEITELLNRPISQELLARDLTRLAYVAKDGTLRNVPIIFTWNGSQIVMCTSKNAPHWGLAGRGERPTLRRRGARGKRLVLPHSQPARYGSCLTSTPLRGDVHNRRRRGAVHHRRGDHRRPGRTDSRRAGGDGARLRQHRRGAAASDKRPPDREDADGVAGVTQGAGRAMGPATGRGFSGSRNQRTRKTGGGHRCCSKVRTR